MSNKMSDIDTLLRTGSVITGYRVICGKGKNDPTIDIYKKFDKEIKKLEKDGLIIAKIPRKVNNAWATKCGGWWHEFEFRIISEELLTPNVRLIAKNKYRIILNTIPREVRKELNAAVKNGILFHLKKDGLAKECYYFIGCDYEARNAVASKAIDGINALAKILI